MYPSCFLIWIHVWNNDSYLFIFTIFLNQYFVCSECILLRYEFIHYIYELIIYWIHTFSYIFMYEFITRRNQFHTYEFIHYIHEFIISWIHTFSYIFIRLHTSAIRVLNLQVSCAHVCLCVSSCIMFWRCVVHYNGLHLFNMAIIVVLTLETCTTFITPDYTLASPWMTPAATLPQSSNLCSPLSSDDTQTYIENNIIYKGVRNITFVIVCPVIVVLNPLYLSTYVFPTLCVVSVL